MLLKTRTVWNINENLYFCESTFSISISVAWLPRARLQKSQHPNDDGF